MSRWRWRGGGALVACVLCLAAVAGVVRAPAVRASDAGAVVVESSYGIFVVNADGSALTRLTRGEYDGEPVWSPDASRIAFSRIDDGETAAYVVKPDGSGLRRLGSGMAPAWSPDGARLAFQDGPGVVETSGKTLVPLPAGLTIATSDGSGTRRIPAGDIASFTWSPDSKQLAYSVRNDRAIHLASASTGARTKLASVKTDVWDLAWSPDGSEMAYDDGTGLRLFDVATHRTKLLVARGRLPVWSPDGTQIAFSRGGGGVGSVRQLLVIGRDGSGEHRLDAAPDVCATGPGWSSDGSRLVFSRPRIGGTGCDVWQVSADGKHRTQITRAYPSGASFESPQWAATAIPQRAATAAKTITLSPSRQLGTATPVLDLIADAGRAAVQVGAPANSDYTSRIAIWDVDGRLRTIAQSGCEYTDPLEFAFAGRTAAWICDNGAAPPTYELSVGSPGSKSQLLESVWVGGLLNNGAKADDIGSLAGHGNLLVYNTWSRTRRPGPPIDRKLLQVVGSRTKVIASGADALWVVAVDANRIAVLRPDHRLVILNNHGERLSSFTLNSAGLAGARLTGQHLILLRGSSIEIRNIRHGSLEHRWPTAPSDAPITLEDAQGNYAVYTGGIAIHLLRLSDGHDLVLTLANEEGPADADLEPAGLYYTYNQPNSTRPGRIAFAPLGDLNAHFASNVSG